MAPHIVALTGGAPYLGGPQTWLPLRAAAPELSFVEFDALTLVDAPDPIAACRDALIGLLAGASGIVAHGTTARAAIEAVAAVDPELPVLLLSPLLVTRTTRLGQLLRAAIGSSPVRFLLRRYAASKQRRLVADVVYVRKQLRLLVADEFISDTLVAEARTRLLDLRTARVVSRTAEVLVAVTQPIDAQVNAAVTHRAVLVGGSPLDRQTATRMAATVVAGSTGALMLERPNVVAEALRTLLSRRE